MNHALKIFQRLSTNRSSRSWNSETQFGFRYALGTGEAVFAFNVLVQRCLKVDHPLYICFQDCNKAFDKVRHDQLIHLFRKKNIDMKVICIFCNLYYKQAAVVRERTEFSDGIEIRRGVRQRCVLSPVLFKGNNPNSSDINNHCIM